MIIPLALRSISLGRRRANSSAALVGLEVSWIESIVALGARWGSVTLRCYHVTARRLGNICHCARDEFWIVKHVSNRGSEKCTVLGRGVDVALTVVVHVERAGGSNVTANRQRGRSTIDTGSDTVGAG